VTVATEPWAPSLEEVAGHIPTRTRDGATPGSDALTNTFSDTTTPTESQAQRITDAAVATVAGAVGTIITTKLEPLARDAAGWRAAADIELAYPQREADVSFYTQLDDRAKLALARLLETAGEQGGGPDALLPVWCFPEPCEGSYGEFRVPHRNGWFPYP
jgi:hypothetical protein